MCLKLKIKIAFSQVLLTLRKLKFKFNVVKFNANCSDFSGIKEDDDFRWGGVFALNKTIVKNLMILSLKNNCKYFW